MADPGYEPTKATSSDDTEYMNTMRDRFETARVGWRTVREDFKADIRFVSGSPEEQWDPIVLQSRKDDGVPALSMDRLNPLVNQIVNQSRKDRPQPKVNVGDGGIPEVADALEGKMRHVMYASHADVVFDYAEAYCASGGFGFYRVTKEYAQSGKKRPTAPRFMEPRLRRIPDPLTVYPDPSVQELDFSDMKWCFVPKKYKRKEFKKEFHKEPCPFPFEMDPSGIWSDEQDVMAAEYWWIETKDPITLYSLADGRFGSVDDLGEFSPEDVMSEEKWTEEVIHCDIVDGEKKLEESVWEGSWIPLIPVIGKEVISNGTRRFVSAVRYARDPQTFTNAAASYTAWKMATVNDDPYMAAEGTTKSRKWHDGKRHFVLEYGKTADGQWIKPERNNFEPNIQGSSAALLQGVDAIKGAVGYVDSVTRPSQSDISGVAVQRRDAQANLSNMQYEDSLTDSMWHCGRVVVDLLQALTDTPRVWTNRREDGTETRQPVTMDVADGASPFAPGMEDQQHLKIDDGEYGVTISVGPSFNTKNEEGTQFLLDIVKAAPALLPIYLPAIFKRLGYEDLEEIALAAQPPQIQQAIAQKNGQGLPPQILAAQAQALTMQNQQLKAILQQVAQKLQTKEIETQGKLDVEKLKTIREIIVSQMEHSHDAVKASMGHHVGAAAHLADLFHQTEMAPDPNAQSEGGIAVELL